MVFTFSYTGYILLNFVPFFGVWAKILHHSAPYAVLGPRFPPRKPPQASAQPPSHPSIDMDAVTKRGNLHGFTGAKYHRNLISTLMARFDGSSACTPSLRS